MTLRPQVFIDFNDDGVFTADESISSDVLSLRWQRGREPDVENTPAGTAEFVVSDTNGDYVPDNALSRWGADADLVNSVRPGREVSISVLYQETSTYQAFRGRINRIAPKLGVKGDLTVTFYCVDAMDELGSLVQNALTSTYTSTGGVSSSGGGFRVQTPAQVGSTVGVIARVLDNASWSPTRRNTTQDGPVITYFWSYQESAKAALDKLETHDFRSMIFVNSSGSIVYHSSTHHEGSIAQSTFNDDIHGWDYTFSLRNVYTAVSIASYLRPKIYDTTDLGQVPTGAVGTDADLLIDAGSTLTLTVPLNRAPVKAVTIPLGGINGGGKFALCDTAGGTTFALADYTINGRMAAGSVLTLKIVNNGAVRARVHAPAGQADTDMTLCISGRLDVGTTDTLLPLKFVSTGVAAGAIDKYRVRRFVKEYPFANGRDFAVNRVTAVLDHNAPLRADYTRMTVIGSNSTDIPKVLSRDLGDRISVSASRLGVLNEHFYITAGEWELNPDGRTVTVVYSLEKAT